MPKVGKTYEEIRDRILDHVGGYLDRHLGHIKEICESSEKGRCGMEAKVTIDMSEATPVVFVGWKQIRQAQVDPLKEDETLKLGEASDPNQGNLLDPETNAPVAKLEPKPEAAPSPAPAKPKAKAKKAKGKKAKQAAPA